MKDKMFRDGVFWRKLRGLAAPIGLQSFMLASVAAADAFMLGRVDQNSMAAVSLATQVQFVQNMLVCSGVKAASILGAQYWGKRDRRSVSDVLFLSLRCCSLVSLLFFLACEFAPVILMKAFTDDAGLISIGIGYLRLAGWSYLLTGISQCLLSTLKVTEHAAASAKISSGAVIINIVLNAVFIYGWFGIPAMGVKGAALATLTARAVELVWSVTKTLNLPNFSLEWDRFLAHNAGLTKDFLKCAGPLVGAYLFWGVGFTSYTAFVGHLGADAAAANSVAAVVRDLMCCFCEGIAAGGGIMVGNELGAGRLELGKLYGDRCMKLSYLTGFACTLIMAACTPLIMRFVKLNEGARGYLTGMMLIMAFYMIGRCVNTVVINGVFSAGGDTLFDMYSLAVCMWGIAVPLAALGTFVFHWPVLAVYACTCLDEVGKIPWVMLHYRKYKWVRNLTR